MMLMMSPRRKLDCYCYDGEVVVDVMIKHLLKEVFQMNVNLVCHCYMASVVVTN